MRTQARTISQFRILHFLKRNFAMGSLKVTLSDADTIEVWDGTGNCAIITTVTDDPDYVEVESGIYFCEI